MTNYKERNSNLELLRIISMILIVLHHYTYNNFIFPPNITINKIIIQILLIGGKIGVNCFILITGYFMINSQFKLKKLLKISLQVLTYSIIFLIFGIMCNMELDVKSILKSCFPIIYSQYWFITTYVIMYIFSDFINDFINQCTQKRMIKLILLLILVQAIIPTFTGANFQFSNVLWFMTLYIIGAYIRKFPTKCLEKNRRNKFIAIFSIIIIALSIIILDLVGEKIKFVAKHVDYFTAMNSIFIVISSICLFVIFKNIKIKNSNFINTIASTMFGVYLIHTNIFMRKFIWIDIFKVNTFLYKNTILLIINVIISVTLVITISSIIDLIRQKFIEPLEMKIIGKISNILVPKIKKNKFIRKCYGYINN